MRTIRLLLIPTTAAWFIAALWWIGNNTSREHIARSGAGAPHNTSVVHLGPENPAGNASAVTKAVPEDPSFDRLLVIPFVKNKGELLLGEAGGIWCAAVRDHLASHPEAFVSVTGHTDADGEPALNMRLSIQRAEIVKEELIKRGLPAGRITAEGMGSYEPIADNTTSKGKAQNRRVEIRVMPPTTLVQP